MIKCIYRLVCHVSMAYRRQLLLQPVDPVALMKSFTRLFTMVGLTSAFSDTIPFFLTLNTCYKTEVLPIAAFTTTGSTVAYNVAINPPAASMVGADAY